LELGNAGAKGRLEEVMGRCYVIVEATVDAAAAAYRGAKLVIRLKNGELLEVPFLVSD